MIYYGGVDCASKCGVANDQNRASDAKFPVDQNPNLDHEGSNPLGTNGAVTKDWTPWYWMRDSQDARIQFLWTTLVWSRVPDNSDAGVTYYMLTSDDLTTPRKLQAYLTTKYAVA